MHWIESHGFEMLLACYVFALITSVMPPLPANKGFWATWFYNVIQIFGANANNLVKHSTLGQKIDALVGDNTDPKG